MLLLTGNTTGNRVLQALSATVAGLSLVGAVALGWWAPQLADRHAEQTAAREANAASMALTARCSQLRDAATAMARQVQQYAAATDSVSWLAADAAAGSAAASHPEMAFAVLDRAGRSISAAGVASGEAAAAAGGYGASCAQLRAPSEGGAALAERYQVNTPTAMVGWIVAWYPLDAEALAAIGSHGVSIEDRGRVVAGPAPGGGPRVVVAPHDGMPYTVVSTSDPRGKTFMRALALVVLLLGLGVPVWTYSLVTGQSRRLNDQLRLTNGELAGSQHLLADTFTHFGGALEHTHDLEGLLDSVVSACVNASGAVAGVVVLVDPGLDQQRGRTLMPLGSARTDSPLASAAAEALPGLADRFLAWAAEPGGLPGGPPSGPLLTHLPAAGPALAVPMAHDGRLVGVLAIARGEGARAFDALAPMRVREIAAHAGTAVENVRTHEEVRRLSVTDPLTGVGNVRQLSTTLGREVAGALRFDRRLTVLMLDLDHFKQVNDTLGHQFGDFVLREFAHRLMACVREMDTVARYGGEEFAIVLPETDLDGGCRVAERVMTEIRRQPFRHGDLEYSITVSIGVAGFPMHGRSVAEVLQSADAALYSAKRDGRDRWQVATGPADSGAASRVSQAG